MSDKKLILVTGGAGFIGSHLCERLVQDGHKVISLDNYFTGSRENHIPGVDYREGHTKDIEKHVPETPDLIYHLGEYSRVEQSVLEPELVYDLNVIGTRAMLDFWQKRGGKFVYAGSSTKFGDGGSTRDTSPYARSKAENSELVRAQGETTSLPYSIAYFYNVYGPRERAGVYGTVIEQFKRMYLSGAPCAVVSPGTQERNFTHVSDIVDGLVLVGEQGEGDEYGIGNPKAYAIYEVAKYFGFTSDIIMFPPRPGNRMSSSLDSSKTKALGWMAKRELPAYIQAFTSEFPRGKKSDARILVFATTMHPVAGLAEEAFLQLAKVLPDVQFDVVTTRFTQEESSVFPPNMHVYRIGIGYSIDKFLLPFLGFFVGLRLTLKHRYLFVWSLMASYAALATVLIRTFTKLSTLITLADQNLDDLGFVQRFIFAHLLSAADQVYGTHGEQESAAMHASGKRLPRNSLGEGDAFANALRYAYADLVRQGI